MVEACSSQRQALTRCGAHARAGGSTDIAKVREKLALDRVIGCCEMEYSPWAPIDSVASLWHLFISRVAPAELPLPQQKHLVFVGSTVRALSGHAHTHTCTSHTLALVTRRVLLTRQRHFS